MILVLLVSLLNSQNIINPLDAAVAAAEIKNLKDSQLTGLCRTGPQKQRLTVFAARFFGYGCKVSHLKTLGMALQGVIGEILIVHTKTPWSSAESSAWDWFWGYIEASIRWTIEAYEQGAIGRVRSDWKAIRTAHTDEEFGDIFYSELKDLAPEFLSLFVRPRKLQYSTFVDVVETLVGFAVSPEDFYEQVKPLAIRHIKYGVTPQHVKRFGAVLQNVLKRALGESYTEESQKAWNYVWTSVSRCIGDCLSIGSNLITVALVTGETEELERALSLAPRGQRSDWITRVQIHDSVISPFYWAVRDGKLDMARVMIRDLLALRADREAYYYGYDQLWNIHPDIVTVLCRICPELLEDLFDGMLWHSALVEDDSVRVNYYLRELYGDPEVFPDPWDTPFGVLALQGPTTVFVHPLVTKVLDIKWRRFGMFWFLALEGWYTVVLVTFEIAYVGYEQHDCSHTSFRVLVGVLAAVTSAGQLWLVIGQVQAGQVGQVQLPFFGWSISLPRWLHKRANCLRLLSMGMLTAVGLYDPCVYLENDLQEARNISQQQLSGNSTNASYAASQYGIVIESDTLLARLNIVCGVVSLLLWLGTFQFFTLSHKLSAFMFTVGTLISDVSRVIAVVLLLMFAFGTALARLESHTDGPFNTFEESIYSLLRRTLQLDPPVMDGVSEVGGFFVLMYALLASRGMLNILIAQMTENVQLLSKLTESFAIHHRVQVTLEVESMLSSRFKIANLRLSLTLRNLTIGFYIIHSIDSTRKTIWNDMALYDPLDFEKGMMVLC